MATEVQEKMEPRVGHFSAENTPWRQMGQYAYRIIEDGTKTQNRISAIESKVPPHSTGPVFHFHEMHDECFYVTKGVVRFHIPGQHIDAKVGDFLTIPIGLIHKFSNPFDEEGIFINMNTPGYYVQYFAMLEKMVGEGTKLTPEVNKAAMMRFATVPLTPQELDEMEEKYREKTIENGVEKPSVEAERVELEQIKAKIAVPEKMVEPMVDTEKTVEPSIEAEKVETSNGLPSNAIPIVV